LWKGTTASLIVASRPKVSFWRDGSTGPGNYGYTILLLSPCSEII
jgi:hypothetical protein